MRLKRPPMVISLADGPSAVLRAANGLRAAINERRLPAGVALPSSRDLAEQLGVARNTVLGALALLHDSGLIETRAGAGSFIRTDPTPDLKVNSNGSRSTKMTGWAQMLPVDLGERRRPRARIDLYPGVPDLKAIPFDEWRRCAARKLKILRARIGDYGSPEGAEDLRFEIAKHVARSRGITCTATDVLVTSGAQQAFDLISRILVDSNSVVAVEDPGYGPAISTFRAGGASLLAIAVDAAGLDVSKVPNDASLVYVTPSHQFPLGMTMAAARRSALLAWAEDRDGYVVEDDYDSDYQYTRGTSPALKALDADQRVIYVGTFSTSLMPGIRLGFLILPRPLREVFVSAKLLVDWHSNNVSQAVLADLMASGIFARHIVKMRQVYSERRATILRRKDELSSLHARLIVGVAGLHLCLLLPRGVDEERFIVVAAEREISLLGLRSTFVGQARFAGLVLGFGNAETRDIETGMERILTLLKTDEFSDGSKVGPPRILQEGSYGVQRWD